MSKLNGAGAGRVAVGRQAGLAGGRASRKGWASLGKLAVMAAGLAMAPGCGGMRSVRPGVNKHFEHPDVEKWVERFEGEGREIYANRAQLVELVGLNPGMAVADVGAGTGFMSVAFAEVVGPTGVVYAVDLAPEFIDLIRKRAAEAGLENIKTVVCTDKSVKLPDDSVDVVFVCDTYHHFEYPAATLRSIHRAIRKGGELVIVEFKRVPGESREWTMNHVRAAKETFIKEIGDAGFSLTEVHVDLPFLKENYVLRFRKID